LEHEAATVVATVNSGPTQENAMTRGLGGESPSNIASYLKGLDMPADKRQLIEVAQGNDAEKQVIEVLRQLPDQDFETMADVMKAYGEVERNRS
jgi:uncharacterized protein DUF2795